MKDWLHPLSLVLSLGLCYSFTIAPDLTWAHFSADGGDLITAVYVNGVPHPAGYPLYLILAKLFQILPFGSLAFRTNLFSAICTILASLVLFSLIRQQMKEHFFRDPLALLGALFYGLAPMVWGQALVTEVYALHGLLVALCLYVFLKQDFPEFLRGFVFGLAASNHIISVLLFPLLFFYGDRKAIGLRFAGVFGGLLLYITLPLRAIGNPPVNWGNPSTLQGFIWLVGGAAYRSYVFNLSFFDVIARLRAVSDLALHQFTVLGLFLAFYGLFLLRRSRVLLATLWTSFVYLFFSVTYSSYDSQVYLIANWICISIWIPVGFGDLFLQVHARAPRLAWTLFGAAAAFILFRVYLTLPEVNLSSDMQAQEYIESALQEIPRDALVFVTGDEQIFSLWYARFSLRRREDAVIVAEGLLQFEWYNKNLRSAYPSLTVPDAVSLQPFDLIVANPQRRICYVSADALKCI